MGDCSKQVKKEKEKLRVIMEECGAPQKQLAKMNPVSAISYFEK